MKLWTIFLLIFAQSLAAQTLSVELKRNFWPDARGEIQITEKGIAFSEANGKNRHEWSYQDLQSFDRLSKSEFVLLTYEDQRWKLGRDREYQFKITSGELSDELFESIRQHLAKPVTDRVVDEIGKVEYRLPVKHLHTLGGCEGELIFAPEAIYYSTPNKKDAREWRLKEEVQSIWSADPYSLELHVYENNRREFSRTRVYNFTLKKPLDPIFYRNLKLELYGLELSRSRLP